jgi:hypothetical protein
MEEQPEFNPNRKKTPLSPYEEPQKSDNFKVQFQNTNIGFDQNQN